MKITENFDYLGSKQNFERDSYATISDMVSARAKDLPDIFIATCKETGKLYIYNKDNEADETLGKWREAFGEGGSSGPQAAGVVQFDVYNSYSQGYKTYSEMMQAFTEAGGNDFGVYGGDGGRGLDGLLPPNVAGDRAKSATVYVINASRFGNPECTLITSAYGKSYIGHFTEEATNDNFNDGDISVEWVEVASSGSSDSIPTYEVGQMSTEDSLLSTDIVVEEIQKHTDQAFFVSQYNAYESRLWFVTYSPYMNYRRPNTWTATYGNKLVVITKGYESTYPLSFREYTLGEAQVLFANNGPELDIYGFTQGHISSNEMLSEIGDNYYASYSGDYGRGNEPFIPGQVESRADSATVYIENAREFGTQKCKLFAINTVGEVFEGFFVTQRTTPTFTDEGLVWRKVGADGNDSIGTGGNEAGASIYYLPMESVEGEENFPEYSYEKFNFRREQNLIEAVKGDLHDASEVGTFVKYDKGSYDGYPEIYQLTVFGYNDAGMDMAGTKWIFKPLINKDGRGTVTIKYNPYDTESNDGYSVEETVAANTPEEETEVIDFSTWPEYSTGVEVNGIVLDGQGGANIDNSDVSVDPDDIEEDD